MDCSKTGDGLTWPSGCSLPNSALGNELSDICSTYFTEKCFINNYTNCISTGKPWFDYSLNKMIWRLQLHRQNANQDFSGNVI